MDYRKAYPAMRRTETRTTRLRPDEVAALREYADKSRQTVASVIRDAIVNHVGAVEIFKHTLKIIELETEERNE